MRQDIEVLLGGVQHRHGVAGEQPAQRRQVDGQRVDQGGLVAVANCMRASFGKYVRSRWNSVSRA